MILLPCKYCLGRTRAVVAGAVYICREQPFIFKNILESFYIDVSEIYRIPCEVSEELMLWHRSWYWCWFDPRVKLKCHEMAGVPVSCLVEVFVNNPLPSYTSARTPRIFYDQALFASHQRIVDSGYRMSSGRRCVKIECWVFYNRSLIPFVILEIEPYHHS